MAHPVFDLYLAFFTFLGILAQITKPESSSSLNRENSFVPAKVGDSIVLWCFYDSDVVRLYWYKQAMGQTPKVISSFYKYETDAVFYNEFKNNSRFTLDNDSGKNHLKITDLRLSDSATYYCATGYTFNFEFIKGILVDVKGSGLTIQALVHPSESKIFHSGGSETLSCTVHTGSCDEEHSVYWFKNSKDPHPGLIYTLADGNDQCEKEPNTQTRTCIHNLPINNLNDSGTYYCAVASCGHMLFGNGTKVDLEDAVIPAFVEYLWIGTSVLSTLLSALFVFFMCVMSKRKHCPCQDSNASFRVSYKKGCPNGDNVYYIAIKETEVKTSRGQVDETWSECIYFSVKP